MKSKHIQIRSTSNGTDVVVDDYELFDYVDDILTDRGLESEYTNEEERNGGRLYIMHFGSDVSAQDLSGIVDEIPAEEVDRIWGLNN